MNERSQILHPFCKDRSQLDLSVYYFSNFYSHGGKLKHPTTKPSLSAEQKQLRVEWAKDVKKAILEM